MRPSSYRVWPGRLLGIVALAAAIAAVAVVLSGGGGGSYEVHARFIDAGQLVKGGLVQVGGRSVGSVKDIRLTDDNQADVVLKITDEEWKPLHRGTRATIRTVGLSGVANRFVDVHPGPRNREEIEDGGTLSTAETTPIVDLDVLLNALDEPTRKKIQSIIRNGAKIYAGSTAQEANRALAYLNPALAQGRALTDEITRDAAAVERLISSSATVVQTLASRRTDLEEGVSNSAKTLRTLAAERDTLSELLERTPDVLDRGRKTLGLVRGALDEVEPALREARPSAKPLADLLETLVPVSRQARPVIADVNAQLPALRRVLNAAGPLDRVAQPLVSSLRPTVEQLAPIIEQLRPYVPDVVAGILSGFGGRQSGYYDANGHYARINLELNSTGMIGLSSVFPQIAGGEGNGVRTGLTARCPGGAAEPAPDRSNPFVPSPANCNPEHNVP